MDDLINIGNKTFHLILLLSAVPIGVATVVGLLVGLFQTVTQMQDQTLPYGAKLAAVVMSLMALMGWMSSQVLEFAREVVRQALTG
ncbi:type III secretion system export apparatus subunit SctS [Dyella sp. Tek66A03]|uniref:type III secretion system export apparatus subunit SctS n=1 Tax=Dyella sp. Tek66A03 TaxID=3458298 RepID=UPI00403E4386